MDSLSIEWDKIKEYIRTKYNIKNIAYNIWLAPLLYGGCEDNVVSIIIPNGNPELFDYIKKNYTDYFETAMSETLQKNYKVRYTVVEQDIYAPQSSDESEVIEGDQPTECEKRVAILQDWVNFYDYEMPDEVLHYIAEHFDILDLWCAYINMRIADVRNLKTAKVVLNDTLLSGQRNPISLEMILLAVSEYYHLEPEDIKVQVRNLYYIRARRVFAFLCKELTDLSLKEICCILNKSEGGNPFHDFMWMCAEMEKDEEMKGQIETITDRIMTLYSAGKV